jgi:DNA invertase Pin-like site-specific DNA recombinase
LKAAAYVRVSSRAQSSAMQRGAIEIAARARGDEIAAVFSDSLSGGTLARPGLKSLRSLVQRGNVRKVYVFRLDRLTRSGIRDTLEVVEEFKRAGCEIVSIADGFDVGGPAAEIVLAVLAWAAKVERLAINERIAAARDRVEREGGRWGRPPRMTPRDVLRARGMRDAGRSIRSIAVALKVARATLARALSRKPGPHRGGRN